VLAVEVPSTADGRAGTALAHIACNAVDRHRDILARFAHVPMPEGFRDDRVRAADAEARHVNLVCDVRESHASHDGALPAHAGLWRAATDTAPDLLARLAVVPMVLAARGLDVTPLTIETFRKAGEASAVAALASICADEGGHVAHGATWFHFRCGRHDPEPKPTFHALPSTPSSAAISTAR
jgi:uncharacterized ferritin-like protein (DUF455 family)